MAKLQALSIVLLLGFYMHSSAQTTKIRGTILDDSQKPLSDASVSLLKFKDSALVKIALTDSLGQFELDKIKGGQYRLLVSFVGLKTYWSDPLSIESPNADLELPPIKMVATTELQAVTVSGKKPFIERKIDRTVINPEALIGNAGVTALEVLEKAPGVAIDANDNISLRGKTGVMIFVDDKPTYLPASELPNYLRGLPSGSIETIELMTNPPAKYDAAGNAGVINIRLKKTKVKGLNGGFSLNYGQGFYRRTNNSFNFNYRVNKVNFFGNLAANSNWSFQDLVIERRYLDKDAQLQSLFHQNSYIKKERSASNLRLGLDYYATKKTTVSFVLNGFYNPTINRIYNAAYVANAANQKDSTIVATNTEKQRWHNGSVGLNYTYKLDTTGKELSASADYIRYGARNGSDLFNSVYWTDGRLKNQDNIVGQFPATIDIQTGKLDYSQPLAGGEFSVGGKTSFIQTDNTANLFDKRNGIQTVNDDLTNSFQYRENINAVYVNFNKNFKKWTIQSGLRLENTNVKGYQFGSKTQKDSSFTRDYTNLFPTFYASYKLDTADRHQLGFSYGYRINRPDYQDLNPFSYPLDKFTIYAGNTLLRPVFTHNVELSHTYEGFWTTTLLFNYTTDDIQETIENGRNNVFFSRPGNIGTMWLTGLNSNAQLSITKWWTAQVYGELNHLRTQGKLYGQGFDTEGVFGSVQGSMQFKINPLWTVELSGFYRSGVVSGQFSTYPMKQINAGIQRKILKEKGTLRLFVQDMFYILRPGGDLSALANSTALYYSVLDSRVALLTFSYRFNKGQSLRARQNDASENERSRVKAG
jgi:outer membrane receptor protein involved in Fe transport